MIANHYIPHGSFAHILFYGYLALIVMLYLLQSLSCVTLGYQLSVTDHLQTPFKLNDSTHNLIIGMKIL